MSVYKQIQEKVWRYNLNKEMERLQRQRATHNLSTARTVGILYNASEESDYKRVAELVKYLQGKQITVKALGYINQNMVPHYCIPKLSFDYFHSKNVNWYGKPNSGYVNDFVKNEFDILMDLNVSEDLPLLFVAGTSRAAFKVGKYGHDTQDLHDLMMDLGENDGLNELIRQILHYLTLLNNN